MKRIILILFAVTLALTYVSCSDNDDDKRIDYSEVPATARAFVSEHFSDDNVIYSESNSHGYKVKLKDGTEIEFDSNGVWRKIDMNNNPLPQSIALLINPKILDYVALHYPGIGIEELERERGRIYVELRNDIELVFEESGEIVAGGGASTEIELSELPEMARNFLNTHFAGITVKKVERDAKEYEVELYNGTEIEFDLEGNFKSVEVEVGAVPKSIIMPAISTYVAENYTGKSIEEYTKLSSYYVDEYAGGYTVELSGEPEIKLFFSKTGAFLKKIID